MLLLDEKHRKMCLFLMVLVGMLLCVGCGNGKETGTGIIQDLGTPQDAFHAVFGFDLPASAEYIECDMDAENKYWAKISFSRKDYDAVRNGLEQVYPKPTVREEVFNETTDPFWYTPADLQNVREKVSWFDLSYEDVDLCYFRITSGKNNTGENVRRIDNWVFTQLNSDDTVMMYVIVGIS